MTIKKAIEVLKTYNHDDDKEGGQAFKVAIKSLENKLNLDLIEFLPYNLAIKIYGGKADLYDIPIEELDLSVRSYNCVRRKGIKNIGELAELDYEELTKIRNLGRKSVEEIIRNLKEFNVYLKGVEYDQPR